ncbi:hypothetical protein [Streptomyces sp. NPDC054804]
MTDVKKLPCIRRVPGHGRPRPAALFLGLFVAAENPAAAPLLRLDLLRNRAFAVVSSIAVVGMSSAVRA